MILRNCDIKTFAARVRNKKLVCFGAYVMPRALCSQNEEYNFQNDIAYLVDNDVKKHGMDYELKGIIKKVYSVEQFAEMSDEDTILLITSMYYADIIEQLEKYKQLNTIECYIYPIIQSFRESVGDIQVRTTNEMLIPKKIHYFWFGRNEKPELVQRCLESWRKYCPDYEIIEWNENNYDVNKHAFMKEAYESGKWGFVPDYARIDVLYKYGGIYMDTDVEIVRNIDDLLYNNAYFGFGSYGRINTGAGFGGRAGSKIFADLLNEYDHMNLYDENGELLTNTIRESVVFKKYGVTENNQFQINNGITFYPCEFFEPKIPGTGIVNKTSNTYTIHHSGLSWLTEEEYNSLQESINRTNKIIEICRNNEEKII